MLYHITKPKKNYVITQSGVHVFYFENITADMTFDIKKSKAVVYIFGLYTGTGTDRYTLKTTQKHTVPTTKSYCLIKGIFDDSSRFNYEGKINITKNGHGTDAIMENRNLIISDHAMVTTKPELSIIPSDVTCAHAATVSYINEQQLDMIRTRGISLPDAESLLIDGFINDFHFKRDKAIAAIKK